MQSICRRDFNCFESIINAEKLFNFKTQMMFLYRQLGEWKNVYKGCHLQNRHDPLEQNKVFSPGGGQGWSESYTA